jgi:hypothetical protein
MQMKLELVAVPVSDVDRGWTVQQLPNGTDEYRRLSSSGT